MRLIAFSLIAGLLVLGTCSEAAAFGRGERHGGGGAPPHGGGGGVPHHVGGVAPPHVGGGGWHGGAAGPFGGVHNFSPPHEGGIPHEAFIPGGGERGAVTRPFGGTIIRPEGGVRPEGAIGEGARGGVGVGSNGVRGGTGGVGHSTAHIRSSTLHGIGMGIRGREYPYFTRDWYRDHGGAWFPGIWGGGLGLWDVPLWGGLAPFIGIGGPPIDYDYGGTAVFQGDTMYLNGEPLASAGDYAGQALAFDDAGRAAMPGASDEWEPLGVFGLIQGNETVAQRIFQLAVNKAGVVRGNYYDAMADNNLPVFGEVDPKSQRVVWSIGDKKDIVYEAGLNNLLQNETTVLIHFGKVRTQQMILVRLPPPPLPPPPMK